MAMAVFLFFMLLSCFIGARASKYKKKEVEDYLLTGRSLGPTAVALSALSSNFSGFMFIGFIGVTYTKGFVSLWLMVGWIIADFFMWTFVYERLRKMTEEYKALTIPSFINEKITGKKRGPLGILLGIVIVVFLACYASAQLTAGSKALHVIFDWHYNVGAIMGGLIVLLYCFSGGIRASVWTDVLQSIVMLASMILLSVSALSLIGGFSGLLEKLELIDSQLLLLSPRNILFGFVGFLLGWLGNGFAVLGQPHIIIRPMMIQSIKKISQAKWIYFSSYIVFIATAFIVALSCRIILHDSQSFDSELALPLLSKELLHPSLLGLILAGIFSATMSTADSQILSCTASISQDIAGPKFHKSYIFTKLVTILLAFVTVAISLSGTKSVYLMVMFSWSGLGVVFGPLLLLLLLNKPLGYRQAILMVLTGVSTLFVWKFVLNYGSSMNEAFPGIVSSFACYYLIHFLNKLYKHQNS